MEGKGLVRVVVGSEMKESHDYVRRSHLLHFIKIGYIKKIRREDISTEEAQNFNKHGIVVLPESGTEFLFFQLL